MIIYDNFVYFFRSEHEPYLTPGNPGNFEPLREEQQEGPGENGEPHFTKQSQKREVDESINSYGENKTAPTLCYACYCPNFSTLAKKVWTV